MTTKNKTTAAQTTLLHAAELLEDAARKLQISQLEAIQPHWKNELDIRAAFDYEFQDKLITALELRRMERSIHDGKVAVSPSPTFEGERK